MHVVVILLQQYAASASRMVRASSAREAEFALIIEKH
jgi:hypothetical protein